MCRSDLHHKTNRRDSTTEKIYRLCGLMVLEKAYDSVNREALWEILGMYDAGCELLNSIKSMYANSLACVRVKGSKNERFRIDKVL